MKNKWEAEFSSTTFRTIEVEAESESEAELLAEEALQDDQYRHRGLDISREWWKNCEFIGLRKLDE